MTPPIWLRRSIDAGERDPLAPYPWPSLWQRFLARIWRALKGR